MKTSATKMLYHCSAISARSLWCVRFFFLSSSFFFSIENVQEKKDFPYCAKDDANNCRLKENANYSSSWEASERRKKHLSDKDSINLSTAVTWRRIRKQAPGKLQCTMCNRLKRSKTCKCCAGNLFFFHSPFFGDATSSSRYFDAIIYTTGMFYSTFWAHMCTTQRWFDNKYDTRKKEKNSTISMKDWTVRE